MSSERERYVDYVRTQLRHEPFLSRAREAAIMEDGHKYFALSPGEARWLLAGLAHETSTSLETDLDARIEGVLRHFAGKDDKIEKADFAAAVSIYANWVHDGMPREEIERKIKRKITEKTYKVGRSGLLRRRRWFRKI